MAGAAGFAAEAFVIIAKSTFTKLVSGTLSRSLIDGTFRIAQLIIPFSY